MVEQENKLFVYGNMYNTITIGDMVEDVSKYFMEKIEPINYFIL